MSQTGLHLGYKDVKVN